MSKDKDKKDKIIDKIKKLISLKNGHDILGEKEASVTTQEKIDKLLKKYEKELIGVDFDSQENDKKNIKIDYINIDVKRKDFLVLLLRLGHYYNCVVIKNDNTYSAVGLSVNLELMSYHFYNFCSQLIENLKDYLKRNKNELYEKYNAVTPAQKANVTRNYNRTFILTSINTHTQDLADKTFALSLYNEEIKNLITRKLGPTKTTKIKIKSKPMIKEAVNNGVNFAKGFTMNKKLN